MIEVKNLTQHYGAFKALDDVSFTVNSGEVVAFLGPNGAGKTTTMRIITGFMAPTSGDVFINGLDVFDEAIEAKKTLGYLPETPPLYPELTVREYLNFVAELKQVEKDKIKSRVDEVIELTGIQERTNTLIRALSKGYRQRVGIAQSIVNKPSVLILDEPSVGLDPTQVIDIRKLITGLAREEKRTVILSTHILAEAEQICEKAVIINDGKIITDGRIEEIRKNITMTEKQYTVTISLLRNHDAVISKVKEIPSVQEIEKTDDKLIITSSEDIRESISCIAVENSGGLLSMKQEFDSLEQIFVKLVK